MAAPSTPLTVVRRRLRGVDRAEQLLDVAEGLFVRVGYDQTSMSDVASEAGVSRAVLYEHFGSKEGLLEGCRRRAQAVIDHEFQQAVADVATCLDAVMAATERWLAMVDREPVRWAVLYGGTAVTTDGRVAGSAITSNGYLSLLLRLAPLGTSLEQIEAVAHMIGGCAAGIASSARRYSADVWKLLLDAFTAFCAEALRLLDPGADCAP